MLKKILTLITLTLIIISTTNCRHYPQPPEPEKARNIERLVHRAAALVEKQGESAFAAFRKQNSEWWFDDTYLFIYDRNLKVLLNPAFPNREGTNPSGEKDASGKAFHDEFLRVVRAKGSGWVGYKFPKPGHSRVYQKWSYVKGCKINGESIIIGAGFYED